MHWSKRARQRGVTHKHNGDGADGAPFTAHQVAQIADGDHAHDDAHDLYVLRHLRATDEDRSAWLPRRQTATQVAASGTRKGVKPCDPGQAQGPGSDERARLREDLLADLEGLVALGLLHHQHGLDVADAAARAQPRQGVSLADELRAWSTGLATVAALFMP